MSKIKYKLRFLEFFVKPFFKNLNFWPFSIKFLRHPIYKQIQYEYTKKFSKYYDSERLVDVCINPNIKFKLYCIGKKGSVEMNLILGGIYEREITNLVLKEHNKTDIYLDIGANIGYYSVLFSKLDNGKKVFSYEPITETFNRLEKNISLNNIKNVSLNNFALGNTNKSQKIFLKDELGHNSLLNKENKGAIEKISIKKLDDLIKLKNKNIFIKLDVEGYEFEVIKGMKNLLQNNNCKLILEYNPSENNVKTLKFLFKLFNVYVIKKNDLLCIDFSKLSNLDEQVYLFLKSKKLNY